MNFGEVLERLKENPERRFKRREWKGEETYVSIHKIEMAMTYRYSLTKVLNRDNENDHKGLRPWMVSQKDRLAEDWEEME